ncbi:MAG: zinc-binding alcohol dehydrogenase family protein [Deltaproteobacteria bacterium]|nr:MAG: zinc-binding alcohol dehydrogenase family protein [Deltaproteobacteria bacterium]TMQ26841.1 MAG: zinc-binding alcohol dehydrogenase family protein [Deltaproteobacteria bacterium]
MKAWRLERAGGRLALEELPVPDVRPGSVRVRIEAAPVLSYLGDVLAGKLAYYRFPPRPFTPGTNGVGVVDAVGAEVYHVKPGQRVVLNPHLVANERGVDPAQILIGLTAISPDSEPLQHDWPDGTLGEIAVMPAGVLTPVPDGAAPVERFAVLGKFAVPYGGLTAIGLEPGESLIVNGASGYFGSAAVLLGAAMGAARVVAAGRDAASLARVVAKAGSRAIAVPLTGDTAADARALRDAAGGGAHAAIDLVGRATDASATQATLRALRRGGRMCLMGSLTVPLPLDYGELLRNDWTIRGRFMYPAGAISRLIAMAAAGTLDLGAVELTRFPLGELPAALEAAARMRGLDAVVMTMR